MWICKNCGEKSEDQFDACWKCSTPRSETAQASGAAVATAAAEGPQWKLKFRIFRGTMATWEELFARAAYFASEIGPERVLNISHSADDCDGVVTVWYWSSGQEEK